MNDIEGNPIDLSTFKGKKVLVVNVASKCGFTPQYAELQELSMKYGDKVTVIGFPANNFGAQEPGSNAEIQAFCSNNYGVTFPMFEKISVKGEDQHALYAWLSKEAGEAPSWNFCKYLIDEEGKVVEFFPSSVSPLDNKIIDQL
jgi:glutathione peroxidase